MTRGRIIEWNPKYVQDFLSSFSSSSTIRGYRCHLRNFFEVINKDPEKYIKDIRMMENRERYKTLDQYEKDISKFWKWLIDNKKSPKTIANSIDAIKQFLKQYKIYLDDDFWSRLRRRGLGNKPMIIEKPLTPQMLKKILNHADVKARSMFLTMASSGIRVGELVKIRINDLELDKTPGRIKIVYRGADTVKTKKSRTSFISNEAAESLKDWLNYRDRSLKISESRMNLEDKHMNIDDRVFPFSTNNVRHIWAGLITKAEMDEKFKFPGKIRGDSKNLTVERYMIHPHCLRKMFRTYMSKHNRDIAELNMGHEGYLDTAYLRFSEEDLENEYLKGMKYVSIYESVPDLSGIHEELKEKDEQLKEVNRKMELMDQKIHLLEMQVKQKELENEQEKIKNHLRTK